MSSSWYGNCTRSFPSRETDGSFGPREHGVEIEHCHVVAAVVDSQFSTSQRLNRAHWGVAAVLHRRGGNRRRTVCPAGWQSTEQFVVDRLGVGDGQPFSPRPVDPLAFRSRFELGKQDLNMMIWFWPAGSAGVTGVGAVLAASAYSGKQSAHRPREPFRPVADVGAVADPVGPPAVVGVADEVVVVGQGAPQPAVVAQPVLPAGVVDEDELDGRFGRLRIVTLRYQSSKQTGKLANQIAEASVATTL